MKGLDLDTWSYFEVVGIVKEDLGHKGKFKLEATTNAQPTNEEPAASNPPATNNVATTNSDPAASNPPVAHVAVENQPRPRGRPRTRNVNASSSQNAVASTHVVVSSSQNVVASTNGAATKTGATTKKGPATKTGSTTNKGPASKTPNGAGTSCGTATKFGPTTRSGAATREKNVNKKPGAGNYQNQPFIPPFAQDKTVASCLAHLVRLNSGVRQKNGVITESQDTGSSINVTEYERMLQSTQGDDEERAEEAKSGSKGIEGEDEAGLDVPDLDGN
ncbi:hypothetical protein SESBI_23942 [Sesbania bispinosa]|nr:hypothetical protein SESBI_23942 [Sesbania bispinosa]